jgi:DNA topoisomerase-1
MSYALVIVESPGKIKTLQKILGDKYIIKASFGHITEMDPKSMSIDFKNHFEPIDHIKSDRIKVVNELKSALSNASSLYLASDMDREGEAIADQLRIVLKPKKYFRIVFNNITKESILNAIKNPTEINNKLVDAQKGRRVLDRLVGYEVSPLLQKSLKIRNLSAGRVQSVTLRLVIDKENQISDFLIKNIDSTYYKVNGIFVIDTNQKLKALLYNLQSKKPAEIPVNVDNVSIKKILTKCSKSEFTIDDIIEKISIRNPPAPFTTSTLQQEASNKLGFSVKRTMDTAQKLYEQGHITYMRTDSVELSKEAHDSIEKFILDNFGDKFYHKNVYETKSKNAQEAHEAIRPTYVTTEQINVNTDNVDESKLYSLIWKRTIASQMASAKIRITIIKIIISKLADYYFQSELQKIIFAGYLKVYQEEDIQIDISDANNLKIKNKLKPEIISGLQVYLQPPFRYTEASLVKKMEEDGIGRPSTFAKMVETILMRNYVKKSDVLGIKKDIINYHLSFDKNEIESEPLETMIGHEKNKLVGTELGKLVVKYLIKNFADIMDYKFTANMEDQLDEIAQGKKIWYKVIEKFYNEFHPHVLELLDVDANTNQNPNEEKVLGVDDNNNEIIATISKYGPIIKKSINGKFVYAPIKEPLTLDTITLADAIKLFEYPKLLGKYNKKDVQLQKGKFGLYILYGKDRINIGDSEVTSLDDAIKIIEESKSKIIKEFTIKDTDNKITIKALVLNGPYGPYIQSIKNKKKTNHKIPSDIKPEDLTQEKVLELIKQRKTFRKSKVNK